MRVAGQAALRDQVEGVDGETLLGRDVRESNGVTGLADGTADTEEQS